MPPFSIEFIICEIQAVIIDIGDYDIARTAEARDAGSHDADGTCTRDKHILTHEIKGKRSVSSIAVRVEDGIEVIGYLIVAEINICLRDNEILSKCAVAIYADALCFAAEMTLAREAVAAFAAYDMTLAGDSVSDLVCRDVFAYLDYLADIFMTYGHGSMYGFLAPFIPVVDMQVSAADGSLAYLYLYVVFTAFGNGYFTHPKPSFGAFLNKRNHFFHNTVSPFFQGKPPFIITI